MQNRRLSGHQLRGMWSLYDYSYLVVEGLWRPHESGCIETFSSGRWKPIYHLRESVLYRQVDSYLSSLELRGGVIVCRTGSTEETAALYASRYKGWQKPWNKHHAHDEIYAPGPEQQRRGKARLMSREPGLMEKIAAQLPGIDRKAWDVGCHFSSIREMILATETEWRKIPGIGKTTARNLVEALSKSQKVSK